MTGADFRRWRERRLLTQAQASNALLWCVRTMQRYETEWSDRDLPQRVQRDMRLWDAEKKEARQGERPDGLS